jgi:hypothetical protein
LFFHRVSATFLSIVAVASFAAFADDPVIMACHNVNFLAKIQQVGNVSQQIFIPVYMSSAKSVDVSLSSRGLHGYVAHFSHFDPDPDTDILDVQVQVLPVGSASLPDLQTVGKIMMPYFNFSLVANVRYTQINVQANPNAGIPSTDIFELLGADGSPLIRIAQIGDSFGLCDAQPVIPDPAGHGVSGSGSPGGQGQRP